MSTEQRYCKEISYKAAARGNSKEDKRLQHNLNSSLDERKEGKKNPVDESLDARIQREKGKGGVRNKVKKDSKGSSSKAMPKKNNPGGYKSDGASSSSNCSGGGESEWEELDKGEENKGQTGEPVHAHDIDVCAEVQWRTNYDKMKKHNDMEYPSVFRYVQGTYYWMLEKFLEGLTLKQEEYSPILHVMQNGYLKYVMVTPYNQKWLPRDSAGNYKDKQSFNPVSVWLEDRWMLCRRISGDNICRVLFFHLCTFVWEHNSMVEGL